MLKRIKCANCGTIYEIDVPTWIDPTAHRTPCPNCISNASVKADTTWEEG